MDVSVVIPTFQRCGSVARTLGALTRQTLPPTRFEVIVAIDGSDDGTSEMLAERRTPFELRSTWQANRGRAAACNSGIRVARGELIVILDDDMVPSPGCLEAHLAAHPQDSRRCVMGAVPIGTTANSRPLEKYMAGRFDAHMRRLSQPGHRFTTRDFYSGNASVRRDVLLAAGLYDESFEEYGNEDLEMAVRLRAADVEIGFSPEALAEQRYEKSFRQLAADTTAKGRTAVEFAAKHPKIRQDLQLAQLGLRSWRWRLVLRMLLTSTRFAPGTGKVLLGLTTALEHAPIRRLDLWYRLLLDYYYWLGVGGAHRHERLGRASDNADGSSAAPDPRNAELRSRDWKFLTGGDSKARSATGNTGGGAERDLVVLAEPTSRALRQAAACLVPGGVCYIVWRRPRVLGPRRLRRQLSRSGFGSAEHYWSWPPAHRGPPRFWLPIDAPGAVEFFLATRPPTNGTRQLMARLRVGAWRAAWHAGALSPISTVATMPGGQFSSLSAQIRARWESWGIGPRPRSVACIMLTGGESRLNKIVVLAFADDAERPALAIKLARVPEAIPGMDREAAALRAAGERSFAEVAEIPRVLFHEELCGTVAIGETPVTGVPLSTLITPRRYDEVASWVTDALGQLAAGRQPVPAEGWWDRLVAPVISAFRERFWPHEFGSGIDVAVRVLRALPALPIVPEHRDSAPWNVLRSETGRLALVDWESAEPDGLPGLDLVYFLANGAFLVEGTLGSSREDQTYGDMLDGTSVGGRVYERSMARYAAATGVARPDLDSLRLLAWMQHAVVEFDRILATHQELSAPAAMRRSVYLALWRKDVTRLHG